MKRGSGNKLASIYFLNRKNHKIVSGYSGFRERHITTSPPFVKPIRQSREYGNIVRTNVQMVRNIKHFHVRFIPDYANPKESYFV